MISQFHGANKYSWIHAIGGALLIAWSIISVLTALSYFFDEVIRALIVFTLISRLVEVIAYIATLKMLQSLHEGERDARGLSRSVSQSGGSAHMKTQQLQADDQDDSPMPMQEEHRNQQITSDNHCNGENNQEMRPNQERVQIENEYGQNGGVYPWVMRWLNGYSSNPFYSRET